MGQDATFPETASDIEGVCEDGTGTVSLRDIQNRLSAMLEKVVRVFDDNGINYMLDGGR